MQALVEEVEGFAEAEPDEAVSPRFFGIQWQPLPHANRCAWQRLVQHATMATENFTYAYHSMMGATHDGLVPLNCAVGPRDGSACMCSYDRTHCDCFTTRGHSAGCTAASIAERQCDTGC